MKELFQQAETTHGVTVRVAVNFLPEQSRIAAGKWFWVYHIRIENHSDLTLQLLTRHWEITDGLGAVSAVDGEGVVGETPVLRPKASHDYVSGCPLATPHGSMRGYYTFVVLEADDAVGSSYRAGDRLEVRIPHFALTAPATAG